MSSIARRAVTGQIEIISRMVLGCVLAVVIFYAADRAVRDCTAGLYVYNNCLWLWVRERLGLPESKILRAGTLELAGLVLLCGLYLTVRYVFPRARQRQGTP